MSALVDRHTATVALSPIAVSLGKPKSVDMTLNEAWSPYAQGTIRFPMPSSADRAAVDLRATALVAAVRLRRDFGQTWTVAELTAAGGGSVAGLTTLLAGGALANITHLLYKPWTSGERPSTIRDFTLSVRERDFDDEAQELVLTVASFESVLQSDRLVATVALDPGTTDLLTIVTRVLARSGYTLAPGSLSATVAQVAATIWQPGVTAWDYLDSMLQAAGLRLWCDETGTFRISARQFNVDGTVTLNAKNMTRHVDRMTLDPEKYADAVVVKYSWNDALGVSQVVYDVAGTTTPKAALLVELSDTIYPGPGAAAGILARLQNRGRVLDIEAVSDYSVSPGMSATIFPPNTTAQTGNLSAITWHLPGAEMDVSTRGLTDTPPDAYLFGSDSVTFATVAVSNPGLAINAFDWSLV